MVPGKCYGSLDLISNNLGKPETVDTPDEGSAKLNIKESKVLFAVFEA